jgi:hypothetical protein
VFRGAVDVHAVVNSCASKQNRHEKLLVSTADPYNIVAGPERELQTSKNHSSARWKDKREYCANWLLIPAPSQIVENEGDSRVDVLHAKPASQGQIVDLCQASSSRRECRIRTVRLAIAENNHAVLNASDKPTGPNPCRNPDMIK